MKIFISSLFLAFVSSFGFSQGVGINENSSTADPSAILEITSSTKGMLAPRMTSVQRNDISAAATGLIVYDTDENLYYQFEGGNWIEFEITSRGTTTGDIATPLSIGNKHYNETDGILYIYTTGGWASISTNATFNSPYGTIDMVFGTASGNSIEIDSWNEEASFDGYVILVNSENSFTSLSDDETVFATTNYASNGEQVIFNGTASTSVTVSTLGYNGIYYFKMVPYTDGTGTIVYDNSQASVFVTTTSCTYTSGTDTSTDEFDARNDDSAYGLYFDTVESQVCFSVDVANSTLTISSNQWPDHYMGDDISSALHISGKFPTAYVVATETVRELDLHPTYDENNPITYVFSEEGNTVAYDFYQFGIATNGVEFHPMGVEPWAILDESDEETGEENWEWQARVVLEDDVNLDPYGGHTTSRGNYHYHGDVISLVDEAGTSHSKIYGYAADGFPIYYKYVFQDPDPASLNTNIIEATSGYELRSGSRSTHPNVGGGEVAGEDYPSGDFDGTYIQDYEYTGTGTDLDECNGRYGVTPEYPDGTYYYVITASFPITPNCFRGNPKDDWIIGN